MSFISSDNIKAFAENFEDLRIWQEARKLAKEIYKEFRLCKDYGFCDQMIGALGSKLRQNYHQK